LRDRAKMSGEDWDCDSQTTRDPSPVEDVREDSGCHSGGMSSLTSSSSVVSKESTRSCVNTDTKPGRLTKCESIDLKELILNPKTQSEFLWTRAKIGQDNGDGDVDNKIKVKATKMGDWMNKKCLRKLSSLSLTGLSRRNSCKNVTTEKDGDKGRTFYL